MAKAVAFAETGGCKYALWNNCFGIMTWVTGKREQKRYNSTEESFEDFKRIWKKYYKKYPNIKLAIRYTGNDRPNSWLKNVNYYYKKNGNN